MFGASTVPPPPPLLLRDIITGPTSMGRIGCFVEVLSTVSPAGTWLEGVGDGTGSAATFLACSVGFEAVGS